MACKGWVSSVYAQDRLMLVIYASTSETHLTLPTAIVGIFAFGAIQPLGRSIDSTILTNYMVCILFLRGITQRGTCHGVGECIDTSCISRSSCRWIGMARFPVDFPCGALTILVAVHDGFALHTFLQVVSRLAAGVATVHDGVIRLLTFNAGAW
jgi:hypothetical protein